MADEKTILSYKGRPLMRKDNLVYYGSMADSHIVMLQILETKKVGDADVASKVSVELQLTDPGVRAPRQHDHGRFSEFLTDRLFPCRRDRLSRP